MTLHLPVGLNLTSVGVSTRWWLEAVRRTEAAGFTSVWIWDHFISRGRPNDPMLECWTMLAAAAAVSDRIRLGSFVTNVMNRHPAVLARMAATVDELSGGRLELGIGAGGHPDEHAAYGIAFPERRERGAHLSEALDVLRLLLAGGPAEYEGQRYQLRDAYAFPAPSPRPRLVVAGETPAGARLAARKGDAWTCSAAHYASLEAVFRAELARAGRSPEEVPVILGIEVEELSEGLGRVTARWRERGVAELVVHDVKADELEGILGLSPGPTGPAAARSRSSR
jgi:alkanesulfonate monooxygenase SsuD/methylene tetrahydromethanopterin reductase-like flavin-dependent oxidoreductase (luciferase family)